MPGSHVSINLISKIKGTDEKNAAKTVGGTRHSRVHGGRFPTIDSTSVEVSLNSKPMLAQFAELAQFAKLTQLVQLAYLAQFDKFFSSYREKLYYV